jgi:hypothetical protein
MILDQKYQTVKVGRAKTMSAEDLQGKTVIGVLADRELPEYVSTYDKIVEQATQR